MMLWKEAGMSDPVTAPAILRTAADIIEGRGAKRDRAGERSMARTVGAFNRLTGRDLSESDGWMFMVLLKLAREQHGHDPDNAIDAAAYCALHGECAAAEREAWQREAASMSENRIDFSDARQEGQS